MYHAIESNAGGAAKLCVRGHEGPVETSAFSLRFGRANYNTRPRSSDQAMERASAPVYVPRYYALSTVDVYCDSAFNAATLLFTAND